MSDGAPVCNLPNIGQVPALQAGKLFPSVPKAQNLESAIQAANALAQIVARLLAPGNPPFQNNLAPFNSASNLVGTPGINATAGADGSPGAKGKKGEKGEDAKQPSWVLSGVTVETVKVVNPEEGSDDDEDFVIVKRITAIQFTDAKQTNAVLTLRMKPR